MDMMMLCLKLIMCKEIYTREGGKKTIFLQDRRYCNKDACWSTNTGEPEKVPPKFIKI
jgi:hypothetical protein